MSRRRAREHRVRVAVLKRAHGPQRCAWPAGCTREAVDGHELLSRARGGSITDPANIAPLCRPHHDWVTTHPAGAAAMGLALSSTVSDTRATVSDVGSTRSPALRTAVAQRDGGRCADCGPEVPPWPPTEWHADHVVPLRDGGPDTLGNLATRCITHHRAKTVAEARGRAPKADQLRTRIAVRISPDGAAYLARLVAETGCTPSAAVRAMLSVAAHHEHEVRRALVPTPTRRTDP